MRILQVISSLGSGGAEKLVVEMCNYLSKTGSRVDLFTFISEDNFFESKLEKQVTYHKNYNKKFLSLKKIRRLIYVIKQYDIVHVHLFPPFYILAFLSFLFPGKKFIYTEHNTYNNRRKKKYKLLEKIIYSRYSGVTCISSGVKEALEQWIPIQNTILINNFIMISDIYRTEPIDRTSIYLSESDKAIVMVGSFRDNQKDQSTLIRAMKLLPKAFKLLLVGDGALREEKEKIAMEEKVADRVFFLGNRQDVYAVVKSCDYGVLSSNWEGFGIVALEYMACGIPAIGSNVGGLNEVITEKECLFEVGNEKQLADTISRFDRDPELKQHVLDSQQTRLKEYDISKVMSSFTQFYQSLLR